jgi:hypothetical protein
MNNIIREVDYQSWSEIVEINNFSIFFNLEYLKSIELSYRVSLKFYVGITNDKLHFATAIFHQNKKVVIPEYFSINPYWIDKDLSEVSQLTLQKDFLRILIFEFKNIVIKFNTDILDLRPFKWAGFDVELKYTYQKSTVEKVFEKNIHRHYKKATEKFNLISEICSVNQINWESHQSLFKTFYLNENKIENIYKWLKILDLKDLLLSMNVLDDKKKIVGSVIILLDKITSTGYLLFIESSKSSIQSEINAFLYIEVQKQLLIQNIKIFDYLGANIPSIANYKSRFNPELKPYYIVKYKKKYFDFLTILKAFLKRNILSYLIK